MEDVRRTRWLLALLLWSAPLSAGRAAPSDEPVADRDRAVAHAALGRRMTAPRLGEIWYRRAGQTLCGMVRETPGTDEAGWRMFMVILESGQSLVEPTPEEERRDKRLALEKLKLLSAECA